MMKVLCEVEKLKTSQRFYIFVSNFSQKISFLTHYKSINLYFLLVPHGLLQLTHNPQRDTRRDRVVHSGG